MPRYARTRVTLTSVVALVLFGGLVVASEPARADGTQRAEGEVTLPSPPACGFHAFVDALIVTTLGEGPFFSFDFDVDPDTWGGPFDLTPDGTTSDLDIMFWGSAPFEARGFGGESGTVPAGATEASVCLMLGAPTMFQYVARSSQAPRGETDRQVERGPVLVPTGPRLIGPVVVRGCMFINALTTWGAGLHVPCEPVDEVAGGIGPILVDACGPLDAATTFATGRRGIAGYRFEVARQTWGRPFVLEPDLPADLDIRFEGVKRDTHFETSGTSLERGKVPQRASHARVCLVAGPATSFTYQAG